MSASSTSMAERSTGLYVARIVRFGAILEEVRAKHAQKLPVTMLYVGEQLSQYRSEILPL